MINYLEKSMIFTKMLLQLITEFIMVAEKLKFKKY